MADSTKGFTPVDSIDLTAGLREDVNIKIIAYRQLDRKAQAHTAGDDMSFKNGVDEILSLLTPESRLRVRDNEVAYKRKVLRWKPNNRFGWTLSADPHNPTLSNVKGKYRYNKDLWATRYEQQFDADGEPLIDEYENEVWKPIRERGGVNWLSPEPVETWDVDYPMLNELVMDEMYFSKLTWRNQQNDLYAPNPSFKPKDMRKEPPSPMV